MIIYGKQLFLHLLERRKELIKEIYLSKECDKKLFYKIAALALPIVRVDNKKAQAMARGGNHQGFLALVEDFVFFDVEAMKRFNNIALLYELEDVGNIGAIIRTAYGLGLDGVIVVAKNLAIEGVVRASSGAAFEIPLALCSDGLTLLNELKQSGFCLYATKKGGKPHNKIVFGNKNVLIMGNEGGGMPKRAFQKCDESIGIKMRKDWNSLNVSAAFAIICDRMMDER